MNSKGKNIYLEYYMVWHVKIFENIIEINLFLKIKIY